MKTSPFILSVLLGMSVAAIGQPRSVSNPILPGFNPDPSICAVDGDYYLVTSSFVFVPGLPVYHSRDLVNWELISHGIDQQNIDKFHFENLDDIAMATVKEPKTGLTLEAPSVQLKGKHTMLTYGHANNARYGEGPHIYKIGNTYYLLMAEGGSGKKHAVTIHSSNSLTGPYKAQQVNPVLSHRQMGNTYPIQNIGHADIFRAADGQLYAVCLGNRMLKDGNGKWHSPLGRETFLVSVEQQDDQLIFAPGIGRVETEMQRPSLPWHPFEGQEEPWYGLRGIPSCVKSSTAAASSSLSTLHFSLLPEVLDTIATPACLLQKLHGFQWTFSREVTFITKKENEWAGITLYRTANSYYTLMKGKDCIRLTKREKGQSAVVAEQPCKDKTVRLAIEADSLRLHFLINGQPIAAEQSMRPLCDDGKYNKFNGLGVCIYATSMGRKSKAVATFK